MEVNPVQLRGLQDRQLKLTAIDTLITWVSRCGSQDKAFGLIVPGDLLGKPKPQDYLYLIFFAIS